jgi:uncharacterized protein YukE
MYRRILVLVPVLTLATAFVLPNFAHAQGSSGSQTAPAANAPAPASSSPADTATNANANAATSPAATTAPAKKVWTNEDMKEVHRDDAISTVGNKVTKPANNKPATNPANNRYTKQYQDQITRLQEKLPPLDEQIAQLQAVLNGDTVNAPRHVGAKIDDWHEELVQLQKQRDDITTKISALQDEARSKGVPANQIPQ